MPCCEGMLSHASKSLKSSFCLFFEYNLKLSPAVTCHRVVRNLAELAESHLSGHLRDHCLTMQVPDTRFHQERCVCIGHRRQHFWTLLVNVGLKTFQMHSTMAQPCRLCL